MTPRRNPPWQRWNPLWHAWARAALSRAKHRSLAGHPRMALRLSRLVPAYALSGDGWLAADGAPPEVRDRRRAGFAALSRTLRERSPVTIAATRALEEGVSDLAFIDRYRVPFPFRDVVRRALPVGHVVSSSDGVTLRDLDGREHLDAGGSYGVTLFGVEFYKRSLARAVERASALGPVLGPYHPVVADNVARLRAISGLDEVSFHMSGTEAVMQAVRLARYHTRRRHVARFCGAYHGWWDGVQVGPGNPVPARDVLTLADQSERALRVLRMRDDVACVLVNPLQALTPNAAAAADSGLVTGGRAASFDRGAYARWLRELRAVCDARGIPLVFDEVFVGFRLARGGAQEYFGTRADLVAYGKTLGGGLPVGVLCGARRWMRRFRDDRPADVCFARGTFNAHPYVMTAMNELLRHLDTPEAAAIWEDLDERWDGRARQLDRRLAEAGVPVRVANMASVFVTQFTQPGRYHWLLQYYLRAHGIALPWTGASRLIFGHDWTDADFAELSRRFVAGALAMQQDGWFWAPPRASRGRYARAVAWELLRAVLGGASGPDELSRDEPLPDEPLPGGPPPDEPAPHAPSPAQPWAYAADGDAPPRHAASGA